MTYQVCIRDLYDLDRDLSDVWYEIVSIQYLSLVMVQIGLDHRSMYRTILSFDIRYRMSIPNLPYRRWARDLLPAVRKRRRHLRVRWNTRRYGENLPVLVLRGVRPAMLRRERGRMFMMCAGALVVCWFSDFFCYWYSSTRCFIVTCVTLYIPVMPLRPGI